jgi:hypothetical protein
LFISFKNHKIYKNMYMIAISNVSEDYNRSPAETRDFSSSLCDQASSEANPASCTMGTVGLFPRGKAQQERDADHLPHLISSSWMCKSYTSSPSAPP